MRFQWCGFKYVIGGVFFNVLSMMMLEMCYWWSGFRCVVGGVVLDMLLVVWL